MAKLAQALDAAAGQTGQALQDARRMAHGLAGSGQTFGLGEVSRLAREMEGTLAELEAAGALLVRRCVPASTGCWKSC